MRVVLLTYSVMKSNFKMSTKKHRLHVVGATVNRIIQKYESRTFLSHEKVNFRLTVHFVNGYVLGKATKAALFEVSSKIMIRFNNK